MNSRLQIRIPVRRSMLVTAYEQQQARIRTTGTVSVGKGVNRKVIPVSPNSTAWADDAGNQVRAFCRMLLAPILAISDVSIEIIDDTGQTLAKNEKGVDVGLKIVDKGLEVAAAGATAGGSAAVKTIIDDLK